MLPRYWSYTPVFFTPSWPSTVRSHVLTFMHCRIPGKTICRHNFALLHEILIRFLHLTKLSSHLEEKIS